MRRMLRLHMFESAQELPGPENRGAVWTQLNDELLLLGDVLFAHGKLISRQLQVFEEQGPLGSVVRQRAWNHVMYCRLVARVSCSRVSRLGLFGTGLAMWCVDRLRLRRPPLAKENTEKGHRAQRQELALPVLE